ncbi:RRP12-like protein [Zingiber officinale]|uniref:RRP12-like protein n=1 Tax=Zingiber officinale TaxID=94328 RepID=A0A8J5GIX7_ZINOF|nr:RRP12-like protein [Zingiber officinale]KAG6501722.1 hypothetical protein ZIOFF_041605 [Zingiber officinale]
MEPEAMESDVVFLSGDNETAALDGDDLAVGVLSRFQSSSNDDRQHLCATVGAMAQALKDQGIPHTPVAYFGATVSSLDRLSRHPASGSDPATASLLSFLAIAFPKVPRPVVRSRWKEVSETLIRVLGFDSLQPAGVKSGLRCASYLLAVGDKANWSDLSPLYDSLIGFMTDQHQKVRKECHTCMSDVLRNFQHHPVLLIASEVITSNFERYLLLAGGSYEDSAPSEGPKGAMLVLYILNALKVCLPLMAMKYTNTILKYCKKLLELQQPIVTRCIMEVLYAHCSSPTARVSPELLQDLLCSLALTVPEEKSADYMASTARLLHFGTRKVYDLNKEICIVKLPIIFNSLGDILASDHEEAIFAAMEALKGLLCACIDENLCKQGTDQIKNTDGGSRKSGPTIIEKLCATIEGFLGYRYDAICDISFQILSTTFSQLGESSYYLMVGAVKSLADMQNLSDEDFSFRKQLHECLGSAIRAMGPEKFLTIVPLNLDVEVASDANVWLFPILKQHVVGSSLIFFSEYILGIVKRLKQKSLELEKEGRVFSARNAEGLIYALWSLLPAFCNYPVDVNKGFKAIQKDLCNALLEEPELRGIICCSLQTLIRQNNDIISSTTSEPDAEVSHIRAEENRYKYNKQQAEENLKAIKSYASEFFSVLSEMFLKSPKDIGGCLQDTIHDLASISDKRIVKNLFNAISQQLLKVTQEAIKAKQLHNSDETLDNLSNEASLCHARALLLDLASSLLPGLDDTEIYSLLKAIEPAFQDEEGILQKKAYKILSVILKERYHILSDNLDEVLQLMIVSLPCCHFAAKRHRLDCLYILIVHISKDLFDHKRRDLISSFLTEIMLSLKEANKKTRNKAYDLLVEIGHVCVDEEKGGRQENLLQFFNLIAGGLAGETPQMISAAIKGLARLAYEFQDLVVVAFNLLPSTFLLLQRKNREIVKANLGFVKVLVAKSKADGLHMHLKTMVDGLLKWRDDTKNHFKAKVKLLIEMLVKKCGFDAVKAVIPEEHMKLLTNIRKIKERKERKSNSEADDESLVSRTTMSRHSKWNHTRIFSDFGDEDSDDHAGEQAMTKTIGRQTKASRPGTGISSVRSSRKRSTVKSLPEDLLDQSDGDPLDLLDCEKTRSALRSSNQLKRKQSSIEMPEFDADGRLIIHEDGYKPKKDRVVSNDEAATRSRTDARSLPASSSKSQKKRQKTSDSGWAYTGNEYTSKKAGGDFKKKDKLEPYAYWPLDRNLLNRRKERRAIARKGMVRIMKVTKKLEGKNVSAALSLNRAPSFKTKQKKVGKR